MARHAHIAWDLPENGYTWQHIEVALLMDIRDVLKTIRDNTAPLVCYRTRRIPDLLTKIANNTDRRKCLDHPRYQAIRPPRTDCKGCRRMWRRRNA